MRISKDQSSARVTGLDLSCLPLMIENGRADKATIDYSVVSRNISNAFIE